MVEWTNDFVENMRRLDATESPPPPPPPAQPITSSSNGQEAYVAAACRDELANLANCPSGRRNKTLFVVAVKLARLPVDRNQLWDNLIQACHSNGLIRDDGQKSVENTINSAFKRANADGPREIPDKPRTPPRTPLQTPDAGVPGDDDPLAGMFSGALLDAEHFPPLEYAVCGLIPEGFGLLVSPPKCGKSWLACNIGLACAAGGVALGRISVARRPVLYLALEDGRRRLQSRCRRIMGGQPIPADIHFITTAKPATVKTILEEFLRRYGGAKPLLVLDTLGKARPPRPPGTDLYAWDYAIGGGLKELVDSSPGSSLLAVHHTRKSESVDFVDAVSGSQGIAGSADFVLVLSRKRHSEEGSLAVTGRDIPEAKYALTIVDGLWQLDGTTLAAAAETASRRQVSDTRSAQSLQIFRVLTECPTRAFAPAEVSEKLGLSNDLVGRYLRRLADDGFIRRAGRGLYQAVSDVSDCPSPTSDSVSNRPKNPQTGHSGTSGASDTSDTSDTG